MAITTSTKGNEVFTDLPLTFSADQVIWDRKALCFYVMVTPFITYPSGQIKTFSQIRQIIQDTPASPAILYAVGEIITPAVLDSNNNITTPAVLATGTETKTPAVAANPAYTNMITSLGIDAVGTAMDNYVAGLPNPISPLN